MDPDALQRLIYYLNASGQDPESAATLARYYARNPQDPQSIPAFQRSIAANITQDPSAVPPPAPAPVLPAEPVKHVEPLDPDSPDAIRDLLVRSAGPVNKVSNLSKAFAEDSTLASWQKYSDMLQAKDVATGQASGYRK